MSEMNVFEKGVITILVCDAVFVALALPLMLRKVPRNVVYGFRTRTTLSGDSIWYDTNAHFGRGLLVASIVSVVAIAVLYGLGPDPRIVLNLSVAVLVVTSAIATLVTARYLRNRSHQSPQP